MASSANRRIAAADRFWAGQQVMAGSTNGLELFTGVKPAPVDAILRDLHQTAMT